MTIRIFVLLMWAFILWCLGPVARAALPPASLAWNITMSPNNGLAYVFAISAGPSSPNGLSSMGPFRVPPDGYTSPYTTLTNLYTDTQMGGYNGRGSYGGATSTFVGGSFDSSWGITQVVCTDTAASISGNPSGSWNLPFTWPEANFTVPGSYILPGAKILCSMIYGPRGLSLSKANPPQLVPGVAATYTLNVATSTIPTLMDPVLNVVDQLPPNLDYVKAQAVAGGGFSAASCTPSGSLSTGLLLACQLTRQPPVPSNGIMSFEIVVRPTAAAYGQSLRNVAITNPTGSGPPLSPKSCISDGNPQGCAVTGSVGVSGRSLGLTLNASQPGSYTFGGNNGWVTQNLNVSSAGTPVVGDAQAMSASAATTLNLISGVSGQNITAVACTGLGSGRVSFNTASFTLDATAMAQGNAVRCNVTLGVGVLLSLSKANPASLNVGINSSYSLILTNNGTSPTTASPIVVSDQLPPNVQYSGMAVFTPPGGIALTTSSTCSASGSVTAGQLVTCSLYPPGGGITAQGGQVGINLSVMPTAVSNGVVNRAAVDPKGTNEGQTPANCTANGQPVAGCAVTPSLSVGQVILSLSKTNPAGLAVGAAADYQLTLSNGGNVASSSTVVVYEQLPANMQYNSVMPAASASVLPVGVSCTATGTVAAGQLLACSVGLPMGGLPPGGSAAFALNVTPLQAASGVSVVNKAAVDPTGGNAAQTPSRCSSNGTPAGCAVAPALTVGNGVALSLNKANPASLSVGAASSYSLVVSNNGSAPTTLPYIVVADQLPPNVQYTGMAVFTPAGGSTLTASSTCSATGSVAAGQLVSCNLYPSAGGIPANGGRVGISLSVAPQAPALSSVNKAAVDAAGANAVQNPANCTADGQPQAGCAVAPPLPIGSTRPFVRFTLVGLGGGGLTASFNNPAGSGSQIGGSAGAAGWVNARVTTGAVSGGALGAPAQSQASTSLQGLLAGLGARIAVSSNSPVQSGSCRVSDTQGNPATGNALYNAGDNSFSLDTVATGADRLVDCTLTLAQVPTLSWYLAFSSPPGPPSTSGAANWSGAWMIPGSSNANGYGSATTGMPNGQALVKSSDPGGPSAVSIDVPLTNVYTLTQVAVPMQAKPYPNSEANYVGYTGVYSCMDLNADNSGNPSVLPASALQQLGLYPGPSVGIPNVEFQIAAAYAAPGARLRCSVLYTGSSSLVQLQLRLNSTLPGQVTVTGNNGWGSQSLSVVTAGAPVTSAVQALGQAGVTTRLNLASPVGWVLSSVSCLDQNAVVSGNPASVINPSITGNSFELPANVVRIGASLVCSVNYTDSGFSLSGLVLLDNGVGSGGVAHDGVQNGNEAGLGGVGLQLSDCGKTVFASTLTDGAGGFVLSLRGIPAGPVCLTQILPGGYVSVGLRAGNTGGVYDDRTNTLSFNLTANTSYSGLLFSDVARSQLLGEGAQQLVSGQSVFYAHHFVAGTSASVVFTTSDQPSNITDRWSSLIYSDNNCNGLLDVGEMVLAGAVSVQPGQQLCLLLKVNSPAGLSVGARNESTLASWEALVPPPLTGAAQLRRLARLDVSTIGTAQGGNLSLLKQVRRVASCPSTAADTQAFATSNQAQPGQYVEYQLTYSNNSAGPLTAIRLSDSVPAYTVYRSAACGPLPTGLQACRLTQQPLPGGTGALQWDMSDAPTSALAAGLQPGGSGSVVFCVQILN